MESKKRYVVNESQAVTGKLPVPGGGGIFRILIDRESTGAQHFSLLVNEVRPGYKSKEHSHDVEHCWYILQGKGVMHIEGEALPIGVGDAVFAPIGVKHTVESTGEVPLKYVVIYAPSGPEQDLKKQTGFAQS